MADGADSVNVVYRVDGATLRASARYSGANAREAMRNAQCVMRNAQYAEEQAQRLCGGPRLVPSAGRRCATASRLRAARRL